MLRRRAVDLLARREHSRTELKRKLCRGDGDGDEPTVDAILDDLAAIGLQSEERFASEFVRSRIRRGQGPVKIRADLASRGVSAALIERCLDQDGYNWRDIAADVHARRFGDDRALDRRDWARRARFLAGRGFPSDVVARVVDDPMGLGEAP